MYAGLYRLKNDSKMTRKRGTKNEVKIHKEPLRILGQKRQTAHLKLMDLFFVLLLICWGNGTGFLPQWKSEVKQIQVH